MAITNHERVGKALDLLREGLQPFVERELKAKFRQGWFEAIKSSLSDQQLVFAGSEEKPNLDIAAVLALMWHNWNDVFKRTLGQNERSIVQELRDVRNKWAHQQGFSSDDAYRAIDSAMRLLAAISAPQASELEKLKMDLLRVRFDEQIRTEKRKMAGTAVESQVTGNLKAWRDVVSPHKDVASGRYRLAEFAADLYQVHIGEGADEYSKPAEFFRRTFLTESLKRLLVGAAQRLTGQGGDPVVQLQTNFGGGKTHSMLALYHLFSGSKIAELTGVEELLQEAGIDQLPKVNRVVLVGNKISPGNPISKPDGTIVRTLWGELAWQLGEAAGGVKEAQKAYKRIKDDDEKATNPGDRLRELFNDYGPSLVLIDEWVAYARQLHDSSLLPAGTFDTQFTFAQALTESAKLAKNCLLVVSLPASNTGTSPHAQANEVEVGGERGRDALARLQNVIGRVESSWRPASAEEGFEIVRRRLFEPLSGQHFKDRDVVCRAFFDLYQAQHQEFPPECHESDYEKRLRASYPIHPEIFDRLYGDWSTLVKFQRTRGVLRLMATVIHNLWERGDRNPLIMPANIPIDNSIVQDELKHYLPDNWSAVIERDVDGENSLPLRLDREVSNLGRYAACRRVARTVYLGSAPTTTAANRGLEDRRIKLGCVMPGESPSIFGDALRRMASQATYLYQDGPRYWYSTQPTVTKLADDRAEQLRRDPDRVHQEIERRLREVLRRKGDFVGVHPLPGTSQDVPDDIDVRLVVLRPDQPYHKDGKSPAEIAASEILEKRGNSPRLYRNSLVFLAADNTRLQDLDEAVRKYLAWDSVVADKDTLNLTGQQVRQAETQRETANGTVDTRLPETYMWLLIPTQKDPQSPLAWQATKLSGQDGLAERASKKLRSEELLVLSYGATLLRMELDRVPLWRGDHVLIKQLVEDFARYPYLPRLRDSNVLLTAIQEGVKSLVWQQETFAFAESFDEAAGRYRGLKFGSLVTINDPHAPSLIVKSEVAAKQKATEQEQASALPTVPGKSGPSDPTGHPTKPEQPAAKRPKRYHGTVTLDPTRLSRDAGKIAEEVVAHLSGIVGADVKVTVEIEATVPDGASEQLVRIVTENSRALKFESFGFEEE